MMLKMWKPLIMAPRDMINKEYVLRITFMYTRLRFIALLLFLCGKYLEGDKTHSVSFQICFLRAAPTPNFSASGSIKAKKGYSNNE